MKPQIFLALVLATASASPSVQAVEGAIQTGEAHSPAVVDPAKQQRVDNELIKANTLHKILMVLKGKVPPSQEAVNKKTRMRGYCGIYKPLLIALLTEGTVHPDQATVNAKCLDKYLTKQELKVLLSYGDIRPDQATVNAKCLQKSGALISDALIIDVLLTKGTVHPDADTILECLKQNLSRSEVVDVLVSTPLSFKAILSSTEELPPQCIESIKRVYSENNFLEISQDMANLLFKIIVSTYYPESYDILVTLLENYRDKKPNALSRELLQRFVSVNPLENSKLRLLSKKPNLGGSKDVLSIINSYYSDFGGLRSRLVKSDVMKSILDAWRREEKERKMMAQEDRGGVPADTENNVDVEQNNMVATQHHEQEESRSEGSLIHPSQNSQEKTLQDLEKNKKQEPETVENNQQLETAEHKGNLEEEDPEDMASDDKLQEVMKKHSTLDDID